MIHDKRRRRIASRRRHVLQVFLLVILAGTACGDSSPQIESGMENSDTETSVTWQPQNAEMGQEEEDVPDQSEEEDPSGPNQDERDFYDDPNRLTVSQSQYVYQDRYNDIEIYYPQIQDFIDPDKAERINILIENDVKKLIVEEQVFDYIFCVYLNYEVKFLNENIISIFYKGMYGYISKGHGLDAMAIATTIDLEKEKVITLSDIIMDFDTLSELLLDDQFESISTWEGITGLYQFSWDWGFLGKETLIEYMKATEFNIARHGIEWYTDGDKFVIVCVGGIFNEYAENIESIKNLLSYEFYRKVCEGQGDEETAGSLLNE